MPAKNSIDPQGGIVRRLLAITMLEAALAAVATTSSVAQEPAPNPTPTPISTPAPEQAQQPVCPNGGPTDTKTHKTSFRVSKLRGKATVTLTDGLLSVKVKVKGKSPRKVKRLALSGKLKHRPLSSTQLKTFKKFAGRDKHAAGKRKVNWTYSWNVCIPKDSKTHIWAYEIHVRLKATRMSARNDLFEAFPVTPSM